MDVGDRKEWVWFDNSKENLICVRKMGLTDYEASCWSDSDSAAFETDSDDDIEEEKRSNDLQQDSDDDEDLDDSQPIMKMHRRADDTMESGATESMHQQNESKMNNTMQHRETSSNAMESSMMSQEESKTGKRAFNKRSKNSKSGRIRNSDDDFRMRKHASKSPTEALSTKGR